MKAEIIQAFKSGKIVVLFVGNSTKICNQNFIHTDDFSILLNNASGGRVL